MALHDDIEKAMTDAMRAKDAVRLSTLRGLLSAFTNESVSKGRKPSEKLEDDEVLAVVMRAAKQRKDSIEQFEKGGRQDLAEKEKAELAVIEEYLPAQMSRKEVLEAAKAKKEALGIADKADMGRLMGALMADLKPHADGTLVKEIVSELLT